MRNREFRPTNPILDARPRVWVFPAEIFWSFVLITLVDLIVFYEVLQLDLIWVLIITAWLCGTWWLILGRRPYKFLSKFRRVPDWTRGHVRHQTIQQYQAVSKVRKGGHRSHEKRQPRQTKNQR